ncbi:uncharacterized protein LOC143049233 isoform X2 [Mytilus galloprovincialis]|uniref:uncharacterized protein LOC143049233 isoform X2 n=1 Tax=Mytilus galloprovincialis TaxID=29158 RepID=UPI003F7C3302
MYTFSGIVWLVLIWSLFALEVTGLRCFRCEDLRDASLCTVVDVCRNADQVCVTVKDLNDNYQISYRLGCVKKEVCDGPLMSVFKHSCCTSDYCNAYNLDDTTTSKQISSSTVQSMLTKEGTATITTSEAKTNGTEVITIRTEATTIGRETTTFRTEATTNRTEATTTANNFPHQITSQTFNCSGHSFYQWHGQCYYITTHSTPWGVNRNGHHKDPCIGHKMHMVVIDSDEEHNAIVNFVRRIFHYEGQVWLGASFSWDHNKRWHWMNSVGISAHDSHWQSQGEERQHQCLALSGSKWASSSCSHHHKHLCEQ